MKLWKKISLCVLPLLLIGCGNKLDSNYDKMKVSKDSISGYILDLRISGNVDNKNVRDMVKITNFNDTDYKIVRTLDPIQKDGNYIIPQQTSYIKDGKVYVAGTDGKYVVTKDVTTYINPSVYLEGMKNTVSLDKGTEVKDGDNKYIVYKAVFKKDIVNKILKDTGLSKTVSKDVSGTIKIDSKGFVNRIIYNADGLEINANYFGHDTISEIYFPSEIK